MAIPDAVDPSLFPPEPPVVRRARDRLVDCELCMEPFWGRGAAKYCSDCASLAQRLRKVRHKYGISAEEYLALVARAGGRCEACGESPPESGSPTQRELHVDHDHVTGEIRGLLCHGCNLAIGYLRNDPVKALAVASYLERVRSQIWNDPDGSTPVLQ